MEIGLRLLFALFFAPFVQSEEVYFFKYHLPQPPALGTDESFKDFLELHRLQDHRTQQECESADTQSQLTLESAFGPKTGILTASELKSVKHVSYQVMAKAGAVVGYFKQYFRRPRPYITDSTLIPCIHRPRSSFVAYPSGHSTVGYALALVLAERFPNKKTQILKQGEKIGENRLIGGVHHPSDVAAGRALAEQIALDFQFKK
jgi:acid phosphatase (class A)